MCIAAAAECKVLPPNSISFHTLFCTHINICIYVWATHIAFFHQPSFLTPSPHTHTHTVVASSSSYECVFVCVSVCAETSHALATYLPRIHRLHTALYAVSGTTHVEGFRSVRLLAFDKYSPQSVCGIIDGKSCALRDSCAGARDSTINRIYVVMGERSKWNDISCDLLDSMRTAGGLGVAGIIKMHFDYIEYGVFTYV